MSRIPPSSSPLGYRRRQSRPEDALSEEYPYYDEPDEEAVEPDTGTERTPLLPIFSSQQLGMLLPVVLLEVCSTLPSYTVPTFQLTHSIRLLVASRCDTTLTWEQLRSPQVSQFLVKPVIQEIRDVHFSKATLYALMANCLQFTKEIQLYPAIAGSSKMRAMMCELLTIKLLREYSPRDLIDALSYDFDPLQGHVSEGPNDELHAQRLHIVHPYFSSAARISCIEIAIRAQTKRFLSHPLVVQQLQAIWSGNIVFHSVSDNLHRNLANNSATAAQIFRRRVTLYNPRDASLFKLSRLRVPRYRQVLSTASFAILLVLFLAVLRRQATEITTLEVCFWCWSAGFMLDEIVGFNEQGFSLYIMSFWNIFDLGILALLVCYMALRLLGVFAIYSFQGDAIVQAAYDVLASSAVLLMPRLFDTLDHVRYFSQLLIAFRAMAADLLAISILVVISCSGFFVAFALSFKPENESRSHVIYELYQLLMGFTPTAWAMWENYNYLGRALLVGFLFITHFLVITILVTVLTNSFMGVVQNAEEEHQFLFAVNTISMVKSDALFSYVAPTNILAWIIAPLRFVMPFHRFLRLNRTVIKITHFPILFIIFLYESVIMSRAFNVTDLIEPPQPPYGQSRRKPLHRRVHQPSVASFQKDRALEEVFRKPYRETASQDAEHSSRDVSLNLDRDRKRGHNAINVTNWMETLLEEGENDDGVTTDNAEVINRLPNSPLNGLRRDSDMSHHRTQRGKVRRLLKGNDLPEVMGSVYSPSNQTDLSHSQRSSFEQPMRDRDDKSYDTTHLSNLGTTMSRHTDVDGDDEREEKGYNKRLEQGDNATGRTNRTATTRPNKVPSSSRAKKQPRKQNPTRPRMLPRQASTIQRSTHLDVPKIYPTHHESSTFTTRPQPMEDDPGAGSQIIETSSNGPDESDAASEASTAAVMHAPPHISGTASPAVANAVRRNRPVVQTSNELYPDSSRTRADTGSAVPQRSPGHMATGVQPSDLTLALDLASDLGDNRAVGNGQIGPALPSSFGSQMAHAHQLPGTNRPHDAYLQRQEQADDSQTNSRDVLSRLVLARMKTLEEGFQQVIREVQELRIRETPVMGRRNNSIGISRGRFSGPANIVRDADKRKPTSREHPLASRRPMPAPSSPLRSRPRPSGLSRHHSLTGNYPRSSPLAIHSADRHRQGPGSLKEPASSPTPSAPRMPKESPP